METPTLEGPHVRLEPLTTAHLPALEAIAFSPSIWRYMVFPMRTPEDLRDWLQKALDAQSAGTALPWVTISKRTNGTRVNAEAKLLQLTYAFETLHLRRVAFKTHDHNQRSKAAIKAIGGVYEGTFRNHMLMPDGSSRDSAWFSITDTDWPEVKDLLTRRLNAPL